MSATTDEFTDIERLLTEAGLSFTIVDHCPDPACEICAAQEVPAAA
jgi:hypothetical protein